MPRLRHRRGRLLALAALPFAALTTATTATMTSAQTSSEGEITATKPTVRVGERTALRGSFEGASDAPVQIQQRRRGSDRWRDVTRTRTGSAGRYRVLVSPRRNGRWRALLMTRAPEDEIAATGDDSLNQRTAASEAGPTRVRVRSRTRARATRRHIIAGQRVPVSGRVRPDGRRDIVVRAAGRSVTTRTDGDGYYRASIAVGRLGIHPVRVRAAGNRRALGSRGFGGQVTAYRAVQASYYGPGFYGRRTACGQTLTPSTMGTAHRTLPCGTPLRLRHKGRTVNVRVIDRGPFHAGRELDLTYATKQRLGFGSTGTVLMSR